MHFCLCQANVRMRRQVMAKAEAPHLGELTTKTFGLLRLVIV